MAKLSDLQTTNYKTVLAYGLSGSGKTCFATGFPGPIWAADFDGKISSAASFHKGTAQAGLIEYEDYSAHRDWPKFVKRCNEIMALPKEGFPFKTLIIDSITTFSAALMSEVIRQNPEGKRQKVNATLVPMISDYQLAIFHFKDLVRNLLAMKDRCNIVMTAHYIQDKDETTGEVIAQPLIFGKELPGWLPMVFEEVYRCYAERKDGKTKFTGQSRAERKYIARTQITKIPDTFELSYAEMQKHF